MKKYTRLCKQYNTVFSGFQIPVGAIYGRYNSTCFVCTDYSGINSGKLHVYIKKHNEWILSCVDKNAWEYKEVISSIKRENNGYIPEVKTYKNPKRNLGKIVGQPYARKVSYSYTPTGMSIGSLIRGQCDNADYGCVIQNECSYWKIGVDMMRTGTQWQYGDYHK